MLKVKRTGIENYMPGGEATMKVMVIGGPGVGKTRWASGWPEPIYLDIEAGLASVADQSVPYIEIGTEGKCSEDMLQALKWLKNHPDGRAYGTVIVDTLDAFQRKVRQEWLEENPDASSFTGFDAWGYLDTKMQMLMTRLLSLPQNVIVLVHYKDKTIKEKDGSNEFERTVYELQLKGAAKDEVFNDFDLIGWMGSFYKPGGEGEGRVQARGLTFQPDNERWFLKDRLHITPKWLEVSLENDDLYDNYANLFKRFTDRLDELSEGGEVEEVTNVDDEGNEIGEAVGPLEGGAVAPQDPKDMPLDDLTKAELIKMGRAMPSIADEVKTSLLKAELVDLVEQGRKAEAAKADEGAAEEPAEEETDTEEAEASSASADEEPEEPLEEAAADSTPVDEEEVDESADDSPEEPDEEPDGDTNEDEEEPDEDLPSDSEDADDKEESGSQTKEAASDEEVCSECGKDLAGENQDYVKLGFIKYREHLCNKHYLERKKGS